MKHLFYVGILIILGCAKGYSLDREHVYLSGEEDQIWINNPMVEVLEDSTSSLEIKDIIKTQKNNFYFPSDDYYSKNENSVYWLHFSIIDNRKSKKPYRLEFYDFNIGEITLYWLDGKQVLSKQKTGFDKEFDSRELNHKNVSLNLDFLHQDTTDIYVQLKSNQINLLKPVLRSYDDFFNYSLSEYLFLGIFYGLFFFIILYNLIYFFILKEKHYIYYVVYAIGITVYLMSRNGTGFQYIWPEIPWINLHADHTGLYTGVIGLLLFSSSFLKLQGKRPSLYRAVNFIILAQVFFLVFEIFVRSFWFDEFIELLIIQVVFALGFTLRREGGISFKSYMTAFTILNVCFLINYLESLNIIESNVFTVYSLYLGFFLQYFALSFSIAERTRISLKQKNTAQAELLTYKEEANKELERKVEERTNQINEQKEIIEAKNKHIIDSVRYAQNIQQAILPTIEELAVLNKECFVINMPRDIVSGDFYWTYEINEDQFLIVVADCTGHGVPGALMSMIGSSSLENIVTEGIHAPAEILVKLHNRINRTLRQSISKNEDGMDLVVLKIDKKEKTVTFSGAKNPLVVLQNGKIERIKGSKISVGGTQNKANPIFDSHQFKYSVEDPIRLLLYSDGLIDQFGGPDDRKYGSKRLMSFLSKNDQLDIDALKETMTEEITNWKGTSSQIDDILVVGIDLK